MHCARNIKLWATLSDRITKPRLQGSGLHLNTHTFNWILAVRILVLASPPLALSPSFIPRNILFTSSLLVVFHDTSVQHAGQYLRTTR